MAGDTQIILKGEGQPNGNIPDSESRIFGKSIRSLMALMVMIVLCLRELLVVVVQLIDGKEVGMISEPFYGVVYLAIGYFFNKPGTPSAPPIIQKP